MPERAARTRVRASPAVAPMAGQQGGPPGSLIPISRWGPAERPTRPQPTSAIGWPAVTWVPMGTSARAQYHYPPGYGGYGWGGWGGGGTSSVGSTARGMGAFAAGAGYYNVNTAQARSINAQTAFASSFG